MLSSCRIRQNVNAGTTLSQASQAPTITTQWVETMIGASTTWVEVIYTQLFSSVPDQWPSAKSGQIGYGTLKQEKRDLPLETGVAGRIRVPGPEGNQ